MQGTHGFTLDPLCGEFLLTHASIQIPKRGQIYSVNDARYYDWPKGLQVRTAADAGLPLQLTVLHNFDVAVDLYGAHFALEKYRQCIHRIRFTTVLHASRPEEV